MKQFIVLACVFTSCVLQDIKQSYTQIQQNLKQGYLTFDGDNQGCPKGTKLIEGKCEKLCKENELYEEYGRNYYRCSTCPETYQCDGLKKSSCEKGYQGHLGTCHKCLDSSYSKQTYDGTWICSRCPIGYYCDSLEKYKCQKGTEGRNGVCEKCRKDQYSDFQFTGKWYCFDCPLYLWCDGYDAHDCPEKYVAEDGTCLKNSSQYNRVQNFLFSSKN